ncbi:MAG: ATP-grasp domain-containing protein [Candidatus Riflebacteria bacterium]|nr:ATP-grasp domain-containing protein [Candidatus Riflebacteria bacterium]
MKIAVTANSPSGNNRWESEFYSDNVLGTAEQINKTLQELGYSTELILVGKDLSDFISRINLFKPDAIFNLCETIEGKSGLEPAVPHLMRWLGIPFTGNSPEALTICLNKPLSKTLLRAYNFLTPDFLTLEHISEVEGWNKWPAIMKPAFEDASLGIDEGSVVSSLVQAKERFTFLQEKFNGPVLIEDFIDGREINAAVFETKDGLRVGLNEIDFSGLTHGKPKIVTYEAKWVENSEYFKGTPVKSPAQVDEPLNTEIRQIAKDVFHRFKLSGYARIDFRITKNRAFILEMNPNPDLSIDAGMAKSFKEMGLTWHQALKAIIETAMIRKY